MSLKLAGATTRSPTPRSRRCEFSTNNESWPIGPHDVVGLAAVVPEVRAAQARSTTRHDRVGRLLDPGVVGAFPDGDGLGPWKLCCMGMGSFLVGDSSSALPPAAPDSRMLSRVAISRARH